ncbi:nucleoporin NUP35-like isoform X1 [Dermacentor andersoni]|uniref:nucleoporin NUP35-like isoform X1 n=1 Tax=Dermacentor andersoni TaxID=34620 RepID=UPI002155AFEF|nr:nucleoporin NUP35-like isoform X1 [Dermacentor andersoni]XP_050023475.1 nucleoporin NUP35-like isoform X1 [Dermacentor andersoni]XP_050023476.1 nucleoporin NUP35-like isoform X1 [Dermacentor andersoni]
MYASSTPGTPQQVGTPGGTTAHYLPSFLTGPQTDARSPASDRLATSSLHTDGTPRPQQATPLSGPPTRSLFGETSVLSSSMTQDSFCQSPSSVLHESNTANVSGQLDTLFSPGDQTYSPGYSDETWVTVFGFPPSASSYFLQQFSQYGTIVKYKVSSEGNWMHLCYQSRLQAKKALSKNGKVFGSHTMVGVKACGLPDQPGQASSSKENTATIEARPLVQAYRASASRRQVTLPETPTPRRDTTVASRALEYLFGW